jgi:hypothetical protein
VLDGEVGAGPDRCAFFAAFRNGDFTALVAVLDPDVVLRSDGGALRAVMGFVVRNGRLVAIDMLADPARLAELDLVA